MEATNIYAYGKDSLSFADKPGRKSSQYLGHWNKYRVVMVPASVAVDFANGLSEKHSPDVDWGDSPETPTLMPYIYDNGLKRPIDILNGLFRDLRKKDVYYPVRNSDYNAWRKKFRRGGDFVIYTGFKKIELKKSIKFSLNGICEPSRQFFLKLIKISAVIALVVCGAVIAFEMSFPTRYSDCDRHTQLLKGGAKIYGGRKFDVVLCGTGWDKNRMNDWVRLQVWSDRGALLAQRTFRVDWDTNFPRELEYGPDYLTYYDASQQDNYVHRISMPPTWWDWVRARLPLLD